MGKNVPENRNMGVMNKKDGQVEHVDGRDDAGKEHADGAEGQSAQKGQGNAQSAPGKSRSRWE
jgi:hypothetical protein